MAPPDRADGRVGANRVPDAGEARGFDIAAIPDEEHGEVDVRDRHLRAQQEGLLDMRVDERERLAHAADRGGPDRVVCPPASSVKRNG